MTDINKPIAQSQKASSDEIIQQSVEQEYKYGFSSDIEADTIAPGLNENVIRTISRKKNEPSFMLDFRLKAYRHWLTLSPPNWANLKMEPISYQDIIYYSAPKAAIESNNLNGEIDPELMRIYDKLGVPLYERAHLAGISNVAIDAVFDSVSVATTFKDRLSSVGIIFCPLSEAIRDHSDLIRQYLGTVVPYTDNYFAALNAAVFSDGSFCYIPKGVKCPMELSTYFRINQANIGQFERTLIVAEEGSYVSYLEGCTAPVRDENQLHAAVVELIADTKAQIKYSTVQNWYPGDKDGKGGVYNLVTKRGICKGVDSKISWVQVETGSAITWKYPSVVLQGDRSAGEFYSVALTKNHQQADTGTKMIHLGKDTKSTIFSKGISAGSSSNSYRGLVKVSRSANNSRNFTQCDSLLIGNKCSANTFPYIESRNSGVQVEHEATTSKVSEYQLLYCQQRGIDPEKSISMVVNGFCKDIFAQLPMEFALEVQALIEISLEGSVG